MDAQVSDLVGLLAGRRRARGHSYGGDVALALPISTPIWSRCGCLRDPLSWEPWWPGTTAGLAVAASGKPQEAPNASCVA
jgi:hypothetical protein